MLERLEEGTIKTYTKVTPFASGVIFEYITSEGKILTRRRARRGEDPPSSWRVGVDDEEGTCPLRECCPVELDIWSECDGVCSRYFGIAEEMCSACHTRYLKVSCVTRTHLSKCNC